MIYLTPVAGLGNQMFQYAYARALSEEFNDSEIVINPYFSKFHMLYTKAIGGYASYGKLQLNLFQLNENVKYDLNPHGFLKALGDLIPSALIRWGIYVPNIDAEKYLRMSKKGDFKLVNQVSTFYPHSRECDKKRKDVLGWYCNEKYFKNIRSILLKEFQFKNPSSTKNNEMIREISSCNSVAVHIRRGDVLLPKYSFMPLCNEDYYKQGMKYIADRVDNPVFYVFSNAHDDIEWIQNNYKFDYPVKYVDLGNPGYDDMRIMYNCKHFVTSSSSFSWWASYMSKSKDKIVTVPVIPYNKNGWIKDGDNTDVYREDMIKFQVNKEANK